MSSGNAFYIELLEPRLKEAAVKAFLTEMAKPKSNPGTQPVSGVQAPHFKTPAQFSGNKQTSAEDQIQMRLLSLKKNEVN